LAIKVDVCILATNNNTPIHQLELNGCHCMTSLLYRRRAYQKRASAIPNNSPFRTQHNLDSVDCEKLARQSRLSKQKTEIKSSRNGLR